MPHDASPAASMPFPRLWLGPMAGFTDRAMRLLCRRFGAEAAVTEMISAKAVCYADRKTAALARILPDEMPVSLQLFSAEPETLAEAVRRLDDGFAGGCRPAAYDINMGCPMRKIVANGEGGALLRDPALIERLVSAAVRATDLPVTVKIRSGRDDEHKNAPDCARAAESGGASLVTVHARTVRQVYTGRADPSVIGAVKAAVSIPVIGNGDIACAADAAALMAGTGCDGVMVARAAVGRPFLFAELRAALDGEPAPEPPAPCQIIEVALEHLRLAVADKGERRALPELRKQLAAYVSGFPGSAAVRRQIHAASAYAAIEALLTDYARTLG